MSDRRLRVGIAGYGVCQFGAQFSFQNHPNVTVAAVTDLDPGRCAELARACRCSTTYASCEEMIRDDSLEAVFIATDAPSHARLAIAQALHLTVSGIVAHQSACRDGELLKVPHYGSARRPAGESP